MFAYQLSFKNTKLLFLKSNINNLEILIFILYLLSLQYKILIENLFNFNLQFLYNQKNDKKNLIM